MDLVVLIVALVVVLRVAALVVGSLRRSGPSDLLGGLFVAPSLGWPHGVQEEDLERAWVPRPPATAVALGPVGAEPADAEPVAEILDLVGARMMCSPVRRRR